MATLQLASARCVLGQKQGRTSGMKCATRHVLAPQAPVVTSGASSAARVVCSVSGGPKAPPSASKKAMVMRVEDPLAGREYRPAMPGDEPDFWEGSRWDFLGFLLQYLWAFGILLAIVASIYAVQNYSTEEEIPGPGTEAAVEASSSTSIETSPDSSAFSEDDAPPL